MEKLKENQIKKLQDLISNVNQFQLQVGQLETQKHILLHQASEKQRELSEFQKELEDEYGKVSVNIETGEYSKIDDSDGINKED